MKIDLHCHTKAIKKGDGAGRNVTPELFKRQVEDADIKIVAITNHNAFDYDQYKVLSECVKESCIVWPGVEIDVLDISSKRWHLIVVANPKEAEAFSTSVSSLFSGDDLNECTHTLDEICSTFRVHDAIYIAHYHEKKPAVPDEDADKLDRLVGEPYRVFKETANEKSMSIFANYRYNVLVGSDVKDWSHYGECSFSELKLPVSSFEQFCLLARRDVNVVETLMNKKQSKTFTAHPAATVDLPIRIFSDMNIVFGQKGTGKTEIINSLHDSMKASGYRCVKYVASERDEEFKGLLRTKGLERDPAKLGISTCDDEFVIISRWVDSSPTHFENYINWKKTEGYNANKQRMRITQATALSKIENEKEEVHASDKDSIDRVISEIGKICIYDYLSKEETGQLISLLKLLRERIYDCRINDLVDSYAVHLVNYSINKIKGIADKSTNSVSKPSVTGFEQFVDNRLQLYRAVKTILDNLAHEESNEQEKVGSLDEKGEIFINTKYRMLCDSSRTDEFLNGIRKLKDVKAKLEFIGSHIFDTEISEAVRQLNELCEEEIKSVLQFVGVSKQVVNENGEVYSPSNGEKGMLLLQRALMNEADAYFLDEPELGMGNSYIDTSIRPLLVDLSKQHKYVVVATHNANIAVRTLPYMSIYRTHSNGKYSTYIGNPFTDQLVNSNDPTDILNWAEESLKSLEGSRDAFYERKDIYESNHT